MCESRFKISELETKFAALGNDKLKTVENNCWNQMLRRENEELKIDINEMNVKMITNG